MPWIEKEGRTVDEATEAAIAEAGRPREELDVEVIREGAKGLFGLGGEPALVRVRPREEARDVRGAFRDEARPSSQVTEEGTVTTREPTEPVVEEPREAERQEPEAQEPAPAEPVARETPPSEPEEADEEAETEAEREEEARQTAVEMVEGVLERMRLEGDVTSKVEGGTVHVEVFGDDMGILIGRGGSTLEALQELVRAGVQRRVKARQSVVVDVEGYWERRRSRRRGGSKGNR